MADGAITLDKFREILLKHDNIFVDSALFRNEFTYFVNYQILRMPDDYAQDFVKPPFESNMRRISPCETMVSQFTLMDNLRNDRDTYKDANRDMMRDT